jgi:hypothetical protein
LAASLPKDIPNKNDRQLNKAAIHPYQSFSDKQDFLVEDDPTNLVGLIESGKTWALRMPRLIQ